MAKVEITMQALGTETSSCCEKPFERGETMYAVVSDSGEPLGWWCAVCLTNEELVEKVEKYISGWLICNYHIGSQSLQDLAKQLIPIIAEAERERIIKIIQENYIPGRDMEHLLIDIRK